MPPAINFPNGLDNANTLLAPFNIYRWMSSLKVAVAEIDTVITLTDTDDIPSYVAKNFIGIDNEIMWVEELDNTGTDKKLVVTRAQGYSTVAEHSISTDVKIAWVADYHNQLRLAIEAIEASILGTAPVPVSIEPDADPYTHTYTGLKGHAYNLTVSITDSLGTSKMTKVFAVTHWNDTTHEPDTVEKLISSVGEATLDIQITNKQLNSSNFDIIITGCSGGSATITTQSMGATK